MCLFFTIKPNRTFHSKRNEEFIVLWKITHEKEGIEKSEEVQSLLKQNEEIVEVFLQRILQVPKG